MARYTNQMRERAVRMVAEVRSEHPYETAAMRHVAGISVLARGPRHEILKSASVFFAKELDRPTTR